MTTIKNIIFLAIAAATTACVPITDKTRDHGFDSKDLSELKAGIWVDPQGCDHWIIDDGVEGYLSQRLGPNGKPICSGAAPSGVATGPFKAGSNIHDPS